MSGKQEVTFPAVLQALCRHTSVLDESCCRENWAAQPISETLFCHTASAELPMQSCQPGIKHTVFLGEQPGQGFEGGVKPFVGDREGKHLISRSLGMGWKPLVPQGQVQSPRQRLPHTCKQWLRWFWDCPLTSCQHQSVGQRPSCAESCCHLCGVGPNLPCHLPMAVLSFVLLHSCCMGCRHFAVQKILAFVRMQQGYPKCEDTHEQNCLWKRNFSWVLDTC